MAYDPRVQPIHHAGSQSRFLSGPAAEGPIRRQRCAQSAARPLSASPAALGQRAAAVGPPDDAGHRRPGAGCRHQRPSAPQGPGDSNRARAGVLPAAGGQEPHHRSPQTRAAASGTRGDPGGRLAAGTSPQEAAIGVEALERYERALAVPQERRTPGDRAARRAGAQLRGNRRQTRKAQPRRRADGVTRAIVRLADKMGRGRRRGSRGHGI